MERFDLHTHSTHSDGLLTPTKLVKRAARQGVKVMALADHDAVSGLAEAARAAKRYGVRLIPAIESTAEFEKYNVHVLGLGIDPKTRALRQLLAIQQQARLIRGKKMIACLERAGFQVTWKDLKKQTIDTITRPNVARAVIARPENTARLKHEFGHSPNAHEFIAAYIVPGKPGYAEVARPTARQVITAIHKSGGLAILAHPLGLASDENMIGSAKNPWPILERLLRHDFDGIEFYYEGSTPLADRKIKSLARRHDLFLSGGSDFHDSINSAPLGHYTKTKWIPASALPERFRD